jgi:hypothetical protein
MRIGQLENLGIVRMTDFRLGQSSNRSRRTCIAATNGLLGGGIPARGGGILLGASVAGAVEGILRGFVGRGVRDPSKQLASRVFPSKTVATVPPSRTTVKRERMARLSAQSLPLPI